MPGSQVPGGQVLGGQVPGGRVPGVPPSGHLRAAAEHALYDPSTVQVPVFYKMGSPEGSGSVLSILSLDIFVFFGFKQIEA